MVHNEERMILETIDCIRMQTIPPTKIFVLDDGSTDNTGEMIDKMEDVEASHYPPHPPELSSDNYDKKRSTLIKNACHGMDYVVYLDGDTSISCRYMEDIAREMLRTNCVLASGTDPDEPRRVPPESGLVIDAQWHASNSPPFPASVMCAYANSDGHRVAVFKQISLRYRRKTSTNYSPESLRFLGGFMKKCGTSVPHVVWRAVRTKSFHIISGYLAYDGELHPQHVLDWHKMMFKERIKEKIGLSKKLYRTDEAFYILPDTT